MHEVDAVIFSETLRVGDLLTARASVGAGEFTSRETVSLRGSLLRQVARSFRLTNIAVPEEGQYALVLGSPVYFSSATPQLMALLDRTGMVARTDGNRFGGKVGGPIVVARRAGLNLTFAELMMWYFINDMIVPGSTYWTVCLAGGQGDRDAADDKEALKSIGHFGENVAKVIRAMKALK